MSSAVAPGPGATVSIAEAARLLMVSEREVRARLEPDKPHPELSHRRVRRVLRVGGRLLHVIDPEALRLGWFVQLLPELDLEFAEKSGQRARRREERAAARDGEQSAIATASSVSAVSSASFVATASAASSASSAPARGARRLRLEETQGLKPRNTVAFQLRSESKPSESRKPAKTSAQIEHQRQRWRESYARKEQRRKAAGGPPRKREPKPSPQPIAATR